MDIQKTNKYDNDHINHFKESINYENCRNFIELLEILEKRFYTFPTITTEKMQQLYMTLMNNMKIHEKYKNRYGKNIF